MHLDESEAEGPVTSVVTTRPNATPPPSEPPTSSGPGTGGTQDLEARLLLCLSIVDHRIATRDRHEGPARDAHIAQAYAEARAALDGATIDQILEART